MDREEKNKLILNLFDSFDYEKNSLKDKFTRLETNIHECLDEFFSESSQENLLCVYLVLLKFLHNLIETCPVEDLHHVMIEAAKIAIEEKFASILNSCTE